LLPYFMTVQFHPERLAARYPEHQALFDSFVRACIINRKSNL
jgi:gamma-glutamyl-gamma-aminobutyrate hydrolase PuuD